MNKNDFNKALGEARQLVKILPNIKNIILDDWRGWRFIFDTEDVRNCQNDCLNCGLYKTLKIDDSKNIYSQLIKAKPEERDFFGPENFLNCKSLAGYKKCYLNFILKKTVTRQEIWAELDLLMGMRIIYSSGQAPLLLEECFKREVVNSVLAVCGQTKKRIIKDYLEIKA